MAAVADSQLVSVLTLESEVNRDAANQLVRFWLTSPTVAWEVVELKTAIAKSELARTYLLLNTKVHKASQLVRFRPARLTVYEQVEQKTIANSELAYG